MQDKVNTVRMATQKVMKYREAEQRKLQIVFFGLIFCAVTGKSSGMLLALTVIMWADNVLFAARRINDRFVFLMFHITFFVFLLDRPIIAVLRRWDWISIQIEGYGATEDSIFRAVYCMLISLIGLRISAEWTEKKSRELQKKQKHRVCGIGAELTHIVQILAFLLFAVSGVFKVVVEVEKATFIFRHSYVAYYSGFQSQLPYVVYVASTFFPYAMCAFLATLPSKRMSYLVLGFYVLTAIPTTLGGERSKIVLNLCLSLTYFVFRDSYGNRKKWIGKPEKILIVCGGTIGIVLLGAMNYIREGSTVELNIFAIALDFFFKQGVTFSWVCAGMAQMNALRNAGVANYTFGGIVDYFAHGVPAQKMFHMSAIPSGNNMLQITEGHSMSHHLSYLILGSEQYLEGHGTGSSYLLELYTDYDMIGVLVASVLIGALLIGIFRAARFNSAIRLLMLCGTGEMLMMPRSSTIGCMEFLWRIPFWCTALYLVVGSILVKKIGKHKIE